MAILKYLRRQDAEGMPTISVTCVHEILPELICRECQCTLVIIPKFDIDLGIQIVLVPSPARNRAAVRALDFSRIMWQPRGANAPGKNQQPEADKVEGDE